MKAFLTTLILTLSLTSLANASSLFLDSNGSATLGVGDVLDQIVLTDTSHVDIDVGAVLGEITLLDESTADIFGGAISGALEVFEDAVVTLHGTGFTLDGNPVPPPNPILSADCSNCSLVGTLTGGDALALSAEVVQNGSIVINDVTEVPEPSSMMLMFLGLIGLGVAGKPWHSR